jgi:alkylation response protein AidB-like acyl-CoA dehydrogenase
LRGALGIELTEEQGFCRDTARSFARDKLAPFAAEWDRDEQLGPNVVPKLAELGLLGVKVPVELGGSGMDMTSYVLALSEVAKACASSAVTMAVCNLAADILSAHANEEQRSRLLQPYLEGNLGAGTFCLSEPQAGSDAPAMKTTAVRAGDHFVLNGTKQWITNGGMAGLHIVFALTAPDKRSHGVTCFVVQSGAPGLVVGKKEEKMGLRASSTVQLHFEDCRVPAANVLGEVDKGYSVALGALDAGRIGIAAQCLGIAEAALDEGVRYAQERKAFGQSVADFQNSQFAIADSATDLETAWLLTLRAAHIRDAHGRSARQSSMAKLFASEATGRIVDRMLQLHGGYGYVRDYPIERLYRDARVTRIYEGTSEVQRIVISREVLRGD